MSDSVPPPLPRAELSRAEAVARVRTPAIALIVTAALGALLGLLSLVLNALGMGMAGFEDLGSQLGEYGRAGDLIGGAVGVVSSLVNLVVAGFIIWAAVEMLNLRRWSVAVAASAVAIVPCISPCCCVGLPVGIWSLVVLMSPEIKSAFTS